MMIANRTVRVVFNLFFVVVLAGLSVGCQNYYSQEDYNRLRAENVELREANERLRNQDASRANDRDILAAEIDRLQRELAAKPAPPSPALASSGFGGIAGVETFSSPGAITVRVPGDVLFASGRVDLKGSAKSTLSQIASVIKKQYAGNVVRVEGYTDSDPIKKSKWKDNLELSLQRAAAVHRYLNEQGISDDRLYAAGFGETKPQATKAKSRRVEIVVEMQ